MTKPLRSFPAHQRELIAKRRVLEAKGGLGFHAAQDAMRKIERLKRQAEAQQKAA